MFLKVHLSYNPDILLLGSYSEVQEEISNSIMAKKRSSTVDFLWFVVGSDT